MIVHCAAERRPDVVERHTEAAVNLNVHATSTLAKEAGRCSSVVACFSNGLMLYVYLCLPVSLTLCV